MAAGGRAHDPDALGIQFPFPGVGAHCSHCAGGDLQHCGMPVASGAQPVFQDEPGDAVFVKEPCVLVPFVRSQSAVAAARGKSQ